MGFQKIWYLQPPKRKLGTSKKMGTLSLDTKATGAFPGGLQAKTFQYQIFYIHLAWLPRNHFGIWSIVLRIKKEFPKMDSNFYIIELG